MFPNTFVSAKKTLQAQLVVNVLLDSMEINVLLVQEIQQIYKFVVKMEFVTMDFMGLENAFAKIQILIQSIIVSMLKILKNIFRKKRKTCN